MMSGITYEKLRKHVSDNLNPRIREFGKTVEDISRNFKILGLEMAVWYPEKIHTANVGGIDADSYIGYSRIEGRWGLMIRTIERDHESHAYMNQRVIPIESCGNMEIVVNALRKVRELLLRIHDAVEREIRTIMQSDREINELRNPECEF
jgi:hypothetical protein